MVYGPGWGGQAIYGIGENNILGESMGDREEQAGEAILSTEQVR